MPYTEADNKRPTTVRGANHGTASRSSGFHEDVRGRRSGSGNRERGLGTLRHAQPTEAGAGGMPMGRIKNLTLSRLISGGNLISGWAHSRDLGYVHNLMDHYNTPEKVLETLAVLEEMRRQRDHRRPPQETDGRLQGPLEAGRQDPVDRRGTSRPRTTSRPTSRPPSTGAPRRSTSRASSATAGSRKATSTSSASASSSSSPRASRAGSGPTCST